MNCFGWFAFMREPTPPASSDGYIAHLGAHPRRGEVELRGVVVVERKKPAGAGGRLTWNALVEPNDEANHTIQRRIRRAIATSILRVLRRNQSYASTSAK